MSVIEFLAFTTAVTGFIGAVLGTLTSRRTWLRVLLGIIALAMAAAVWILGTPAINERWMWLAGAWVLATAIASTLWFFATKRRESERDSPSRRPGQPPIAPRQPSVAPQQPSGAPRQGPGRSARTVGRRPSNDQPPRS